MEPIRRRQVIDVVLKLLQTQGWRELTIREVGDAAVISAGSITHYFGTRRAMIIDSIIEAVDRYDAAMRAIAQRPDGAAERLGAVLDFLADPADGVVPDARFWQAVASRVPFDAEIRAALLTMEQRSRHFLGDLIMAGLSDGVFRSAAPATEIAERCIALARGLQLAGLCDPADMPASRRRELLRLAMQRELSVDLAPAPPADAYPVT